MNIRVAATTGSGIIGTLRNGDVVRNLGCVMNGSTRWCQIDAGRNRVGWVAGRYLHESFGNAQTLPAPPLVPIPVQPSNTVDVGSMSRFCIGEASAKHGVSPRDLDAQPAFKGPQGNYIVYGSNNSGVGPAIFSCSFAADGSFQYVI